MGLTVEYVIRRVLLFVLIIWVTASINFFVPRMAPGDPIGAIIGRMESQSASVSGSKEMIAEYRRMFGLDEPLHVQYVKYLGNLLRLDFGYSLANFPAKTTDIIWRGLPWTMALLATTLLISFTFGTLLGALLAWPGTPRWVHWVAPVFMVLGAIPGYLKAIILLSLLAFTFPLFPSFGTARVGSLDTSFSLNRVVELVYYSTLPALAIMLSSIGGWALAMRGMMVTTRGQDYLLLAEAKGLPPRQVFFRYGLRNAILPQITSLAIVLGQIVGGAVLVELIFSYPGIGYLLFRAITDKDLTMIQAITFLIVLSAATCMLIIDLIYPRLDPRITYARR
jgi:peptide/nickel transport system permease protein